MHLEMVISKIISVSGYEKYNGVWTDYWPTMSDEPLVLQQPKLPDLESQLIIEHAEMIAQFEKQLSDDAGHAAAASDYIRENMLLPSVLWQKIHIRHVQILKAYVYMCNADATEQTHYVCQYCRPTLNWNKMPNRCVLNGLEVEPIPKELTKPRSPE